MAGENSFIMFIRIHKLRKDNSAQAAVFAALILLVLVMFVMLVVDVGQLVTWRIRMQNAADSAAMAGAVWQARGLNIIAALNIVWVPAFVIDLIVFWFSGNPSFHCTNLVQNVQDAMKYAIPVMAITQVVTYGRANKADIAVPLPTAWAEKLLKISSISDVEGIYAGAKSLYEEIKSGDFGSLTSLIPCWLNVERTTVFVLPGRKFGPMTGGDDVYTFSLAYKKPQSVLMGGLLGIKKTPSIYTTAKAVPYGGSLGGKLPKITTEKDVKHSEKKDKKGKTKKAKDKGKTEAHVTTKISFGDPLGDLFPKPNYKAKFDKTGFERILMVH